MEYIIYPPHLSLNQGTTRKSKLILAGGRVEVQVPPHLGGHHRGGRHQVSGECYAGENCSHI